MKLILTSRKTNFLEIMHKCKVLSNSEIKFMKKNFKTIQFIKEENKMVLAMEHPNLLKKMRSNSAYNIY